jgi:hypothetical protein
MTHIKIFEGFERKRLNGKFPRQESKKKLQRMLSRRKKKTWEKTAENQEEL